MSSLLILAMGSACGNGAAPSSFAFDDAGEGGVAGTAGARSSGGTGGTLLDPGLGGPCTTDAECDDAIDCTDDACDQSLGRCRFSALNERCADGVYCNGIELCTLGVGCTAGAPITCSDASTCTIDRCIEDTHSCEHLPRDADGDGDPVWNCGGTDCDDTNPQVNGKAPEICNNGIDDNCNGQIDEMPCSAPEHDTCADALEVSASSTNTLSLVAANQDFSLSCAAPTPGRRDVVVALEQTDPAFDLDVTATSSDSGLALALSTSCSKKASELSCASGVALPNPGDGYVARSVFRGLAAGAYPLYVSGVSDDDVTLSVNYRPASPMPTNETCGTALDLVPGSPVLASLADAALDLTTACATPIADLVYRFTLDRAADVLLVAASQDGNGTPSLSLRAESCSSADAELDCRSADPARLFRRSLAAGTYFVAVGASGPSDVQLELTVSDPTADAPDQDCATAPALEAGVTQELSLGDHVNAVASRCLAGAVDASYSLTLAARSDVLLVERISAGDTGAASLLHANCDPVTALACEASDTSPVRARAYAVTPGAYAAVAESSVGSPAELTAFVRPTVPATLVAFADVCADAVTIPETGGLFSGNTSNLNADYDAGCDFGGVAGGGAPDQMLRLELTATRRVVFDMSGSDYTTLLTLRNAADCPGVEVDQGCSVGRASQRSFLDLVLPKGDYYVQVDGFAGASGHWLLDVFVSDP